MTKDELYELYISLIIKWSKIADLMSNADPNEIRAKHIEDSKAVIPIINDAKNLIDLGTGAGFPGIPIKLECPSIFVTLTDSNRKKINFLNQVIFELKLEGIEAVQKRAEDLPFFGSQGPYDIVISRAAWPLETFLELAVPYFEGGRCVTMKGKKWREELTQADDVIKKYKLSLVETKEYTLKGGETRCLIVFKKT